MTLEIYDETTAKESSFARVLLLGPPKGGKTTCILTTAPRPFVINCDGRGATKGARNLGAKFKGVDVDDSASWRQACKLALELAEKGEIRTIVVDTVSLLSDVLTDEMGLKHRGNKNSYERWTELTDHLIGGLRVLLDAKAHVFTIGHMKPEVETATGIMPLIAGASKVRWPALVDDWVLLEVNTEKPEVQRNFVLGPQKLWTAQGRNMRRTTTIRADVMLLLKELGLEP
jgi:AAA domain-containing protein